MIGSCAFMNQFATHKCVFHWKRQFLEWVICLLQEHLHDTLTSAFAFLMYSIRRKRQLQPDVLWCNFNYYAVHILNLREKKIRAEVSAFDGSCRTSTTRSLFETYDWMWFPLKILLVNLFENTFSTASGWWQSPSSSVECAWMCQ